MSAIAAAADQLRAALRTVPKLRVYDDLGAVLDPPAAVVGPPELTTETYGSAFVGAVFVVGLCVPADEHAMPRLYQLAPLVATAIHDESDGVVRRATPGTWPAGGAVALPAYLIEVEYPI